ncbi:glycosyltransferase family 4 protein [bacterium]|jgi:glycosyltransferase involved in cell wall biosynthesis|nr:glycosyltransferase family 4 protein [bacterium]MBT4335433.1 glycosyltransferase family 4 protein [bacterium]MBT4495526.1 glycosyltransferase family 4 protein [bacterium]MBT4764184.1 glycosyltransferase family 4 protein [bacterium]MBT5401556.1 glycosyltransferase family 4 protein [bacterium]
MRINFLLPHLKISGGVRIILMYAHFLAERGYKVKVIVKNSRFLTRNISNLILHKPKWFKEFKGRIIKVKEISDKYIPESDVIIASAWNNVNDINKLKGKKIHFIQHDERLYHGNKEEVEKVFNLPFKKIVVSTWLKGIVKNDFNQDSELLLNPIDLNQFHKVKSKRDLNKVRILLLHHDYDWKGSKVGIKIVNDLKNNYPHIELVLFGVRKKDIDIPCDEYHYNLSQSKLKDLYSSCNIFLCPSWDEGSGLPSMEAMACKCALVTYDNGGSRDYAFENKTAMVASRKDQNDLRDKLELLVKDKDLREQIAENGYNHILSMPKWQDQTNKLENILKHA